MNRLLPVLVLVGCPAISDRRLQERRDLDGDDYFDAELGGTDCDDLDRAVNPGAEEVCDGVDNDCDGLLNEADPEAAAAEVEWYLDADGDGFGSELVHERSCRVLTGYVHAGGDCDDTDPDEHPGQTWYLDGDGDGFAVEANVRTQCERPDAYVHVEDGRWDCDDANPLVSPDRVEVCGGELDDDCDGLTDDEDPDIEAPTWFPDDDGDGWGDELAPRETCAPAPGEILTGFDCADGDDTAYPGAPDPPYVGGDTDCEGDDDFDADGDGHASADPLVNPLLEGTSPDDCDDVRSWVHPGAPEVCNGVPDDCTDLASWDPASEDGVAHFTPDRPLSGGLGAPPPPPVDWTGTLTSGGVVTLGEGGTLALCGAPPAPATTWTGGVVVTGGAVAVLGPRGVDATVLDALGVGAAIVADFTGASAPPSLRVEGLTLTNGAGYAPANTPLGGCLYASGLDTVELVDVRLEGCVADAGGGAHLGATTVEVSSTAFVGNTAALLGEAGGGLRVIAEDVTVRDGSTFDGNVATAGDGGGISVTLVGTAPSFEVSDAALVGNVAAGAGGAIDLRKTAFSAASATVARTTFSANQAVSGGALRNLQVPVSLTGCDLSDNTAEEGGGLYAQAELTVDDTSFRDNVASISGGGIYLNTGFIGSSTCASTTPGAGVFRRNVGYAVTVAGGAWSSDGCDYAPPGSANDNTPGDVYADTAYEYYLELLLCTPADCTPP